MTPEETVEVVYSDGTKEMYSLWHADRPHMRYKGVGYVRNHEFTGKPDAVVPAVSLDVEFPA